MGDGVVGSMSSHSPSCLISWAVYWIIMDTKLYIDEFTQVVLKVFLFAFGIAKVVCYYYDTVLAIAQYNNDGTPYMSQYMLVFIYP